MNKVNGELIGKLKNQLAIIIYKCYPKFAQKLAPNDKNVSEQIEAL